MASRSYQAQSALKLCEIHVNKELTSFCRTCNIPICTQCVKSAHMQHDWDHITTVAKEKRALLPELCGKIQSEDLPKLKQQLAEARSVGEDSDSLKIMTRKEDLIKSIHLLANKKLELSKKGRYLNPEKQDKLERSIKYIEKMTTELDVNVGTFSDYDVLEREQEMMKELKEMQSLHTDKTDDRMIFVPGEMNLKLLSAMFGKIHDPSVIMAEEINTFYVADSTRYGICAVSDCRAWISNTERNEVHLLDKEGKIVKRQKLVQLNFVVNEKGKYFYTDLENKVVKVLNLKGKTRIIKNFSPLLPTCISLTKDQKILVNVKDSGDLYQLTNCSRRLVQKIDFNGEVLQSYEFADDGKTRLFTRPSKTAESENGDICIINILSESSGELVILRQDGSVRFTYQGLQEPQDFDPYAVACDSESYIYVANYADKSIHVLAYDGTFIKYLLRDLNSEPCALSLYKDKLWLTCKDRTIHIYSLHHLS